VVLFLPFVVVVVIVVVVDIVGRGRDSMGV
jgi:hypothetical protein